MKATNTNCGRCEHRRFLRGAEAPQIVKRVPGMIPAGRPRVTEDHSVHVLLEDGGIKGVSGHFTTEDLLRPPSVPPVSFPDQLAVAETSRPPVCGWCFNKPSY